MSGPHAGRQREGYVDQFDDYVADLKQFHDEVIVQDKPAKLFLLAHSMGGHLGPLSGTLAERHPGGGALLPMMGINLGACPSWLAKGLAPPSVWSAAGWGARYGPGQGPYGITALPTTS